ncbi:Ig-like domain-containing protein [Clostridium sp. MCC353]|uniref:Ig-like domain-containing protein n=1 Tax=Clostridium sp. MCC353 TaxID=2592646 RepID=UPI001C017340|nr:Ig-like domain-containing protein [Clostridium sp. MCC353]
MKKIWKQKAALVMIWCLIFSTIPMLPPAQSSEGGKSSWGLTAYASSSNADRADDIQEDERDGNEKENENSFYEDASPSNGEELINDMYERMPLGLLSDGSGVTAVVGSGNDGDYASIADVIEALGSDTGVLTIDLQGDTADSETVVFPKDKGIHKIIIQGEEDYQIGADSPVSVVANGIPMVFEAGHVRNLAGGGWNTSVPSTDLTIRGGKFSECSGGAWVTEPGVTARVDGTSKLTIEDAELTDPCFNQIYCGAHLDNYSKDSDVSIKATELSIINSTLDLDMIAGGSYISYSGVNAALGSSEILVRNSHIVLGDGLCGSHLINGVRDRHQNGTCKSINIEVYDSTIEGDILGASDATAEANIDTGNIRIYAKNSNIASIQAGGVYQGSFNFNIDSIDVTLDSCTVNGTHWFTEEFSIIGAGCYVGEERTNPEDDLHINIGTIQYTFINSVLDETADEGIEGLLFLPEGYIDFGASASIGKIILNLNSETALIFDSGTLDELALAPPEGYRFTSAAIDGTEIERDEMDTAVITGLEGGKEITASLEEVLLKDQPPLVIETPSENRVKKTLGEPEFTPDVTGGEEALKIHYTSSNPSVAEIDESGKITLKKAGKTTITAYKQSIEYRLASDSFELTVEEPAASLIPELAPDETGYILVAKKVTPDILETIDEELEKHPQFDEHTTILPMEIKLIDVSTGEEAEGKGSTFTIEYPVEDMRTNPDRYEISILHIPSSGQPYFVPFEMTEQGIKMTVENFSPFVLGYKYTEKITGDEDDEKGDEPDPKSDVPEQKDPVAGSEDTSGGSASEGPEGRWISDPNGWWYSYGNGTYPSSQWAYLPYQSSYDWYYFNSSGYMADGWLAVNGNKYFLHDRSDGRRGSMYTGWHQILGKWYYFSGEEGRTKGALLTDTLTPDGFRVDENGVWIP